MSQHREIFNQLLLAFDYSAKQVSEWTGIHESRLSRFRTGKLDLSAGEFFTLLAQMPQDFQDGFWSKIRNHDEPSWRTRILSASHSEVEEILKGLTEQWVNTADTGKLAS
jgi:hypothetical protein